MEHDGYKDVLDVDNAEKKIILFVKIESRGFKEGRYLPPQINIKDSLPCV